MKYVSLILPGEQDFYEKLIDIASKDNFDDFITEITSKMDPLDINLSELFDRCKVLMNKMEEIDLEIPSNLLLFSAIILKMKLYHLFGETEFEENEELVEEIEEQEDFIEESTFNYEIPPIKLPIKRLPKKRVTLNDLKNALDKAILLQLERDSRKSKKEIRINLSEEDVNIKLEKLLTFLRKKLNNQEMMKFEELLERKDVREKVEKFIHILHLEGDEKIECIQNEFLGDLFVKLLKDSDPDEGQNCIA